MPEALQVNHSKKRRQAARNASRTGFAASAKRPKLAPTPAEIQALAKLSSGNATANDYKIAAKAIKRLKLIPGVSKLSVAELTQLIQSADRAVSEGVIGFGGGSI